MTDEKSISEQLRDELEAFLRKAAPILVRAQKIEDEMLAAQAEWESERKAWGKERSLLRDAALTAERRESSVQRELDVANDEISRLLAQLNIIADATERGASGAKISRRLQDGLPAFEASLGASNGIPGAHKGE